MAVEYITRREWYTRRWEELAELIPLLRDALVNWVDGRIQAYTLSHHNIQRAFANLKDLQDFLKACEQEYWELDNVLHGRSRHVKQIQYYQSPTVVRYM